MSPKQLPTPYLEIDEARLLQNLAGMARLCSDRGIALRPHVKTHKTPYLGSLQLKSGASGITVATIGEAEVFAANGFKDIFIAYPLFLDESKAKRLRRLNAKVTLSLGIDSVDGAKVLARAVPGAKVLVEIDSGHHRSGCLPEQAGSVAQAALKSGLEVLGVFTFPGHSYKPKGANQAVRDEASALKIAKESMTSKGIAVGIVSSGSTPTAKLTKPGLITELRPGVYIFNDAQQFELGSCGLDEIALSAVATVVSKNKDQLILDSGSKILGADRAAWATGYGRLLEFPKARITALSEHHATVVFPKGSKTPKLGDRVRVVPNHVCNSVNLVDELFLRKDKGKLKPIKVSARGKNS